MESYLETTNFFNKKAALARDLGIYIAKTLNFNIARANTNLK